MSIGIYKITSPTGKIYVGQSVNIEKRWSKYKRLECINQHKLYNSLKKYGVLSHSFCVLELCEKENLNLRERFYQEFFQVLSNNGLNLMLTTDQNGYRIVSEETKIKQRLSRLGKKHSEESKKKMKNYQASLGRFPYIKKGLLTKKVQCLKTFKIWDSIIECSNDNNFNYSSFRKSLKNPNNKKYKYYEII